MPELTLSELVELYLERHAATVRPRTIGALRWRLGVATAAFGNVPLRDLERMAGEIATWKGLAPPAVALRDRGGAAATLGAAVRWQYMGQSPAVLAGSNPQPAPRPVRTYTPEELEAIPMESSPHVPAGAGVRRRDRTATRGVAGDRARRRRPWRSPAQRGPDGEQRRGGGARQDIRLPSAGAALAARPRGTRPVAAHVGDSAAVPGEGRRFDEPGQLEAPRVGTRDRGLGREQAARIYDLRSRFASDALAAGVSVFELARIMGTSVRMIERHYGALLDGAGAGITSRLDAYERAAGARSEDV